MKLPPRPRPPRFMFEPGAPSFVPAPEVIEWAVDTFIVPEGKLHNPEHKHLAYASLGALWAGIENTRGSRRVIGQCEFGLPPQMGKWPRGRLEQQLNEWFGGAPDFLLTFDAEYCATCTDEEFCALVEHEMLHAGQAKDDFGGHVWKKDGTPKFAIRGHDVEEFVSIVARYGADATHVRELVAAANKGPTVSRVAIAQACGTCQLRRVA